jgi:hypothetical protein
VLGADPYGYQLWVAVGVLHGFNCVVSCKSPHDQGQFAVGCRLDGKPIDPQHILRGMSAAAVHFHNELDVFHGSFLFDRSDKRDLKKEKTNMNLERLGFDVRQIPSTSIVS